MIVTESQALTLKGPSITAANGFRGLDAVVVVMMASTALAGFVSLIALLVAVAAVVVVGTGVLDVVIVDIFVAVVDGGAAVV